jgi:hypothetical protein
MAKRITQANTKTTTKVPQELITAEEFARRKKIWQDIYAKARQGISYQRYLRMREAVQTGDIATIRRIRAEIADARINGRTAPEPHFPDPELEMVYGRLGVKEYWDKKLDEATVNQEI